ncbi:aminoglycoside 3'-phosphotransferase [Candidatus Chloroploca sp. M-50]|uniref:Aminoglycoside 3'-phosphotransferase n=1 Tax=Candidatus Chloroploca mongolica TaxID=2528176 RepID=A0ABS4D3X7_9CHLR|nr:APH(3') family aminoglycoside O-phosphotransferase [Candidatus Chloroploca mongolica]MBP1464153.1 aminoglycoside 3'-phosphotransferase [Candidatus Chloroploca mongolica]
MGTLNLSNQLGNLTKTYRFVPDTAGMSPASVYQLIGRNDHLYLKVSPRQYNGTTYDVEREKDVMLWLQGQLPVPEVLHFEQYEGNKFLLMRAVDGVVGSEDYKHHRDPKRMVHIYSDGIKRFHAIRIEDCPFDSSVDYRLAELAYFLRHNLADINTENWEDDTPFADPDALYAFLQTHKPNEELVFSHGDFGDSNIFIRNDRISGLIDLGRSGKADKWYDIAFCVQSIQHDIGNDKAYVDLLFNLLEIEPDWAKIRYYILLDELF